MKSMIVFALFIASAVAAPNGYGHGPALAAVPVVSHAQVGSISHTPIYNVQKVHHTVHPISVPVHHPAVTSVHQEPTAVLAKAPKLSGYAYTSEVRHDAPVQAIAHHAAPVAVGHGAVAVGHGAVDIGHGPVLSHGGAVAVGHGPAVEVGHAPAPYVSGSSLQVAPAVIKETPAVSSYQLNTGRIDTVSQAHYGTVHTPITTKVGYQAHSVPVAVSHGSYGHGSYGHGGY